MTKDSLEEFAEGMLAPLDGMTVGKEKSVEREEEEAREPKKRRRQQGRKLKGSKGTSPIDIALRSVLDGLVILSRGCKRIEMGVRKSSFLIHYLFGGTLGYVVGYLIGRFQ